MVYQETTPAKRSERDLNRALEPSGSHCLFRSLSQDKFGGRTVIPKKKKENTLGIITGSFFIPLLQIDMRGSVNDLTYKRDLKFTSASVKKDN